MEFTEDQQKAIDERNNNILVSAAAGSGKTAVLSERILTRIIDDNVPIDKMLIMTFTEAAASEMKEKIRKRMVKALDSNISEKQKSFLEEQISVLPLSNISTIHKFCLNVIKDHIQMTNYSPNLRVASEADITKLQDEILNNIIEGYYEKKDENFYHLVNGFGVNNTDKVLEKNIYGIYNKVMSFADPSGWINDIRTYYNFDSLEEFIASPQMMMMLESLENSITISKDKCEELTKKIEKIKEDTAYDFDKLIEITNLDCDILNNYYELLTNIINKIKNHDYDVISLFDELTSIIKEDKFKNNSFPKEIDDNIKEEITEIRNTYKGKDSIIKKQLNAYFDKPLEEKLADIVKTGTDINVLLDIVEQFINEFGKAKEKLDIIDFTDMEQLAVKILCTKNKDSKLIPSDVAYEYQDMFEDILIDEYQDTSYTQEAILSSITRSEEGKKNLFMVGDVKQSIYGFRNSVPDIFEQKQEDYEMDPSLGTNINLHANFRSRDEILDSANAVFKGIMHEGIGEIEYDDNARLEYGANCYQETGQDYKTEIILADISKPNTDDQESIQISADFKKANVREIEAHIIADRILDMVGKFKVNDRDGNISPCKFKDIAVLLSTKKQWLDDFARIFSKYNIPVKTEKDHGFYDSIEIKTILDYIKVLDNPTNELELCSVMLSPIVNLNNEDLANIRIAAKDDNFYEATLNYIDNGQDNTLIEKLIQFVNMLDKHRKMLYDESLYIVISDLINVTGYDYYIGALPDGERRKANLDNLIDEAINFESEDYNGLHDFVEYIENTKSFDVDKSEASVLDNSDAVTIITVHKSKGLEYPIVFIPELFKGERTRGDKVEINSNLGIAIREYDDETNTIKDSPYLKLIREANKKSELGESIRKFYVAMTRPMEKLILVGAAKDNKLEKTFGDATNVTLNNGVLPYNYISSIKCFKDMILPVAIVNPKLFDIQITNLKEIETNALKHNLETEAVIEKYQNLEGYEGNNYQIDDDIERIEDYLNYIYPYNRLAEIKSKVSVSYIKKKELEKLLVHLEDDLIPQDQDILEEVAKDKTNSTADKTLGSDTDNNKSKTGNNIGAEIGTAYHLIMSKIDFVNTSSIDDIKNLSDDLVDNGLIDEEIIKHINFSLIYDFIESDMGKRIAVAAANHKLKCEQPFMMNINANRVYEDALLEDEMIVQGIIDLYFEEDGEIVLLDYKTDNIKTKEELLNRYKVQLDYYKEALERGTGKKVKEACLYSFKLGEVIESR